MRKSIVCNNLSFRSVDKKMRLVGITVIPDMDAGCPVSMYPPRCSIKIFKSHSLPLSLIP